MDHQLGLSIENLTVSENVDFRSLIIIPSMSQYIQQICCGSFCDELFILNLNFAHHYSKETLVSAAHNFCLTKY